MFQNNYNGTWLCLECNKLFTDEQMGNGEAQEHQKKCDEENKNK